MADLYATTLFPPTPSESVLGATGLETSATLAEASANLAALHPQVQRNLAEIEYDWLAAVLERLFLILFRQRITGSKQIGLLVLQFPLLLDVTGHQRDWPLLLVLHLRGLGREKLMRVDLRRNGKKNGSSAFCTEVNPNLSNPLPILAILSFRFFSLFFLMSEEKAFSCPAVAIVINHQLLFCLPLRALPVSGFHHRLAAVFSLPSSPLPIADRSANFRRAARTAAAHFLQLAWPNFGGNSALKSVVARRAKELVGPA